MKSKILSSLILALSLTSSSAFARDINPDITCRSRGATFSFNTRNHEAAQGDPGVKDDLELKVTRFATARCPGCYSIEASLESLFDYQIELRGTTTPKGLKETLKISAREQGSKAPFKTILSNVPCQVK
ncbi:MAG: hypothetical protein H7222_01415 [Methylotenera sp.]|nr:hypothetical protein [Oligoflexia bacterium]